VPENASLAQEEIFGPVLSVIRAKDLDDALRIANGTKYALTGGVFSRSPTNLEKVKRRFRVGNLYINRKCTGALVDRQPFGGFKLSGIGSKAGGPDYLLQFVLPRTVTENQMRRGFAPEAGRGE
jgi:RHH-type proline utilization regulon transcriptional repressor/proline dehydrogenase/delta 1-pyrroline-5-carboxylate dehydrogenase